MALQMHFAQQHLSPEADLASITYKVLIQWLMQVLSILLQRGYKADAISIPEDINLTFCKERQEKKRL